MTRPPYHRQWKNAGTSVRFIKYVCRTSISMDPGQVEHKSSMLRYYDTLNECRSIGNLQYRSKHARVAAVSKLTETRCFRKVRVDTKPTTIYSGFVDFLLPIFLPSVPASLHFCSRPDEQGSHRRCIGSRSPRCSRSPKLVLAHLRLAQRTSSRKPSSCRFDSSA